MPQKAQSELPPGYVSLMTFAKQHGARETQGMTFDKARRVGHLPTRDGRWKHGRHYVKHALDAGGRHAFWQLWHDAQWFKKCDECEAFEHRPDELEA